jgi:hypothetical protein
MIALRKTAGVFSEPQNLADKPIFHTRVQERRFPVVDEERGLVLSVIRFDHSGKNKTITWADGTEHPVNPPFDQPFSFFIAELFKIVDGKDQPDRSAGDAGAVRDVHRLAR